MLTAAIAIAAFAGLLLAGSATAGKAETEIGDVTIETNAGPPPTATYSGKVIAPHGCRKGRLVTLVHDSNPPFTIGTARTDKHGNWTIKGPYPSDPNDDRIIVKVKQTPKCKGAKGFFDFYDEAED